MLAKAFAITILMMSIFAAHVAQAALSSHDLVGVWNSVRSFGPHIDGSAIVLRRSGDTWNAHLGFEDVKFGWFTE